MDTSILKRIAGRGHNDDEVRPSYYDITGPLFIRLVENRLFENGLGITGIIRIETHYTGIG